VKSTTLMGFVLASSRLSNRTSWVSLASY